MLVMYKTIINVLKIILESMENHSSFNNPNIDNIREVTKLTEEIILKKYS